MRKGGKTPYLPSFGLQSLPFRKVVKASAEVKPSLIIKYAMALQFSIDSY